MKVLIAGAGSVGRSIAKELLGHGHEVTLIDNVPASMRVASVARADWLLADAASLEALESAGAGDSDVIVAATGDDKVNLVVSLLAKSEFGVPRVVARINNPKNEWMFTDSWGVDVPVSTPRIMTALVEEAVSVGDLVQLFRFHTSGASIHEITLPEDSPVVGSPVGGLSIGPHAVLAAIIREGTPTGADPDLTLEAGDQLLIVLSAEGEQDLSVVQDALAPRPSSTD
ncbi:Trk system potassium uptake protein TrkA [Actinomycetales bacterium JB111]|nr:Trk system potassium uptake protein TrkA [Actinomycetales bacterium JB111]